MKSYTDIEQSRKLTEILPVESADMWYEDRGLMIPRLGNIPKEYTNTEVPCWSTSALLEIIRNNGRYELQMYEGGYYFEANGFMTESYFNAVDACVEMIYKLKEMNLL